MSSRVGFAPYAPESTLYASRLFLLDESRKIADEQVIFTVLPD